MIRLTFAVVRNMPARDPAYRPTSWPEVVGEATGQWLHRTSDH